jgi:arylsulfatase A-like enzyme
MSDQHNASCLGVAGHPVVKTPNLDRLARRGVRFTSAYCNNPICAPSRVSFVSGQYCHTHRVVGNNIFELDDRNPNSLGACLRRYGYQTAMIGKAHMIKAWDDEAYEHIRYCDLCDAVRKDPRKNHYFKYLIDHGIADRYEDGTLPPEHPARREFCATAGLPYEHSIEHWTGEETLEFLKNRDRNRPFFVHMSFERPHPHWMPSAEHVDMYDPSDIELGPDADDWFENQWAGRPEHVMNMVRNRMRGRSRDDVRRALAHHFALVSVIDMEIGRVLHWIAENEDLDNTIIVYTADHGDFAGDHGLILKNIGIYESIHRIPFIFVYPGGPEGVEIDGIIESVDLMPTLCEMAGVPLPDGLDGRSLIPVAEGRDDGRTRAICEWDFPAPQRRVNAIRTSQYRLVYYSHDLGGELYDHHTDPSEMTNRWDDPQYAPIRQELLERLFDEVNMYTRKADFDRDARMDREDFYTPTRLLHKRCGKWSDIEALYR